VRYATQLSTGNETLFSLRLIGAEVLRDGEMQMRSVAIEDRRISKGSSAEVPDRGQISYGQRADLVIVHAASRRIEATIANGRLIFLAGDAAHRFIGASVGVEHAAE
jgi:hypothetical protein